MLSYSMFETLCWSPSALLARCAEQAQWPIDCSPDTWALWLSNGLFKHCGYISCSLVLTSGGRFMLFLVPNFGLFGAVVAGDTAGREETRQYKPWAFECATGGLTYSS
jgi:hypothetical protein